MKFLSEELKKQDYAMENTSETSEKVAAKGNSPETT